MCQCCGDTVASWKDLSAKVAEIQQALVSQEHASMHNSSFVLRILSSFSLVHKRLPGSRRSGAISGTFPLRLPSRSAGTAFDASISWPLWGTAFMLAEIIGTGACQVPTSPAACFFCLGFAGNDQDRQGRGSDPSAQ